jgi:predicted PurR-regulated permease PerM
MYGIFVNRDRIALGALTGNRGVPSLTVAAGFVLLVACLYLAQAVLIPIALAILLTFVLGPVTTALQRAGLGRAPSVALVMVFVVCLLGAVGWIVAGQLTTLAAELPKYRHNIVQKVRDLRSMGKGSALEKFQETVEEAKDEFEKGDPPLKSTKQTPAAVQAQPLGPLLVKPLAGAALVFGLLIFMLAQREELRNRLIRVVGYAHLTVTTKALEDAGLRITRYLLMQITINGCFGLIVAMALFLIGLPYAFLWGLLSVPLLFIPLIGFWTAEMPLQAYDGFIEQCEENSREFAVLKNGLIFRRKKEDHFERLIKIECTLEDAEKLLLLATKTRPDIVADIARGITAAQLNPHDE